MAICNIDYCADFTYQSYLPGEFVKLYDIDDFKLINRALKKQSDSALINSIKLY